MSFEFKHRTKYKKGSNNIDKAISYPERELDKQVIMKLASESATEEFELDLTTGLLKEFEKARELNPRLTFRDFLKATRQTYETGGEVESLAGLYDAYEKGIDVMPGEDITSYIKRIRAAEKAS